MFILLLHQFVDSSKKKEIHLFFKYFSSPNVFFSFLILKKCICILLKCMNFVTQKTFCKHCLCFRRLESKNIYLFSNFTSTEPQANFKSLETFKWHTSPSNLNFKFCSNSSRCFLPNYSNLVSVKELDLQYCIKAFPNVGVLSPEQVVTFFLKKNQPINYPQLGILQ